jgi:hypothetical protein
MLTIVAIVIAHCTISAHEISNCDLTRCKVIESGVEWVEWAEKVRACAKDLPDAGKDIEAK